jgi:hypothetical protein
MCHSNRRGLATVLPEEGWCAIGGHNATDMEAWIESEEGYNLRLDGEDSVGGTPHSGTPFGRAIRFDSHSSSAEALNF